MANKIEAVVKDAVQPIIETLGMELVDVEYRTRDDVINITVYIYNPQGTDLDSCERVHNAIGTVLDEADPTGGKPYVLNVSSPGLDRAFKTPRDFERNIGKDVEIKFFAPFEGKKKMTAKLLENNETSVKVMFEEKEVSIRKDRIAKIHQAITF